MTTTRLDRMGAEDMASAPRWGLRTLAGAGLVLAVLTACGTAPQDALSPAAVAAPTPAATPTPSAPSVLGPGEEGAEVRALQQRLNDAGYWIGEVDGSWDELTTQAVYAVQKVAGLDPSGVVDEQTRAAITQGVAPTPRSTGDAIEIDKERQLLMVVRGGQIVMIQHTSTGSDIPYAETVKGVTYTGDAHTPVGSFRVFRDIDALDHAPLGDMYRPKYFNGGIAVHGHESVPTHGASHGCARLTNEAMDRIWENNWMPIGSTVLVY